MSPLPARRTRDDGFGDGGGSSPNRGHVALWFFVVVVVAIILYGNRPVSTPATFAQTPALAEAVQKADAENRVVLALATADWCGPCKTLKRGALQDPRVTAWIEKSAVPVYLDVTAQDSPGVEAAASLGVEGIPALIAIRGGREIDRVVGSVGAEDLLAWLEALPKS